MTRKELIQLRRNTEFNGAKWKFGYCCYQDDKLDTIDLYKLGKNFGIYGWNWTLYYCKANDTFYVSGYRNF